MAARKKARKKSARKKKSTRKKSTGRKKSGGRKKSSRKKSTRRKKKTAARSLVGSELPNSLKAFGNQLRRDIGKIEKQLETAGKDTRRSLARIIRDASHQLGRLEARGQREWRALSKRAEADVKKLVRRVDKAVGG